MRESCLRPKSPGRLGPAALPDGAGKGLRLGS